MKSEMQTDGRGKGERRAMICRNCGKELKEGARFCPYCGIHIGNEKNKATEKGNADNEKNGWSSCKKRVWIIGVAVLLVMIVGVGCISFFNTPERRVQRQLDLGYRYLDNLQYDEACLAFEKAIAIDDKCVEAYAEIAYLYEYIDNTEHQKEIYNKAVETVRGLDKEELSENREDIVRIYLAANKIYGEELAVASNLLEEGMGLVDADRKIKRELIENYLRQAKMYEQEDNYDASLGIYDRLNKIAARWPAEAVAQFSIV